MGPLADFFGQVQFCNGIFLMISNNIFIPLADFIARIQSVLRIIYKISVNRLFILPVRLLFSTRLFIVQFGGS